MSYGYEIKCNYRFSTTIRPLFYIRRKWHYTLSKIYLRGKIIYVHLEYGDFRFHRTLKNSVLLCVLLWAKGLISAKDIHKEMFPAYGGKCSSPRKAVHNWVANGSLMTKRLERRSGSGWVNRQKTCRPIIKYCNFCIKVKKNYRKIEIWYFVTNVNLKILCTYTVTIGGTRCADHVTPSIR
jgi:hypothetical protein